CGARSRHRLAPLDDAFARYRAHDSLAALAHGRWNARLAMLSVRAGRFERSSRSAPARVIWTPVPAARYTAYRPSRPGEVYPPCRPGTPWWVAVPVSGPVTWYPRFAVIFCRSCAAASSSGPSNAATTIRYRTPPSMNSVRPGIEVVTSSRAPGGGTTVT